MAKQDRDEDLPEEEALDASLPRKRLSGKKIVMIAAAAVAVLASAGVAAVKFLPSAADRPAKEAKAEEPETLIFVDLPELVVNLNTGERQPRYLRARISLELNKASARVEVEQKLPRVIDDFQVYLRELRVQDLNGSAGLMRLKEELLIRINKSVMPAEVKDVLFREMLVQ